MHDVWIFFFRDGFDYPLYTIKTKEAKQEEITVAHFPYLESYGNASLPSFSTIHHVARGK
jgi:hypothetical protein